ncbi:hypothetical protein ACIF6L_26495 [Kitasatospora sp. NPDC086009]|uniref:hypothetical protein n=1 Tax=unclassified Kitasatospora TaxID=2633591 RepID=UPI0037C57D39
MVTFAEYFAQQLRDDHTALKCAGCYRRKPRLEFRETPWHGRSARCKFCEGYDYRATWSYELRWQLGQEKERFRGLSRGLEAVRRQRDELAFRARILRAMHGVAEDYAFRYAESAGHARRSAARYRSAWLSARKRATEATVRHDAEVRRSKSFVDELRPSVQRRMTELRRVRAFADDVRQIHGWAFTGEEGQHRDRLRVVYGCLYELWEAEREGRAYVPLIRRDTR